LKRALILQQIKEILEKQTIPPLTKVYLFGSWARNQQKQTSDIDIAIAFVNVEITNRMILRSIRDALEESSIPYHVDVVNFHEMETEMKNNVLKEGILWTDWHNV
jgi:predicted nucleotidyltransferase